MGQEPPDAESAVRAWHALSREETLAALGVTEAGLDSNRAAELLATHGPNSIPVHQGASALRILLSQLQSPLVYLLLVAGLVTLFLQHWEDAIAIGVVVLINTALGFFQEYRAENAIRALLALAAPQAAVKRDGWTRDIPSAEVVPGDVVVIEEGSRVPADLRLIEATSLRIDESLLTGESLPVSKQAEALPGDADLPAAERTNMAFSGSVAVHGAGAGVVVETGLHTEIGRIAGQLSAPTATVLPLERRIQSLSRLIAIAIVVASVITFVIGLATGKSVADMFLATVALAVSAIPEGLPIAVTVALAIGVRRMAGKKALVRRLIGVETLGSCTVVVSDKTGTLTQNRMTVERVYAGGRTYRVSGTPDSVDGLFVDAETGETIDRPAEIDALATTLAAGVLPNSASLRLHDGEVESRGDPTELALLVSAARAGITEDSLREPGGRLTRIPFDSEARYSAGVVESDGETTVYLMGAPEVVIGLCSDQLGTEGVESIDRSDILARAAEMAEAGLRVLAMAVGKGRDLASRLTAGEPGGLTLAGLQGMHDPPRPEAAEALLRCREAGIRVLMVTGDHADTAMAIARELQLETRPDARAVTGVALAGMGDEELSAALRDVKVFARIEPAQKRRIVEHLANSGEVVGVTGDGVNDAPALRAAHLGLAMGERGTDVAKEASDIILLDDNFATVYSAVIEGRTAFANIRNVTYFLIVSGIAEVLAIMGALALVMPLPMLPIQLLWLNVVTNGIQDVGLAFEPGEDRHRHVPPRPRNEGILSRALTHRALFAGLIMAIVTIAVFAAEREAGRSLAYAQTAALTTLVIAEAFLVGTSRSERTSVFAKNPFTNRFLLAGTAAAVALHLGAVYSPVGQAVLRLEPLDATSWLWIVAAASSSMFAAEAHKLWTWWRGREADWHPAGQAAGA